MTEILVIDDDERIRELLKEYLGNNGFSADVAKNAADAKRILASHSYKLLIIDVMMPGQDGISLAKELKSSSKCRDVPILILTALGDVNSRIKGLEMGADDYLSKPFSPKELLLRSRNLVNKYKENISVKFEGEEGAAEGNFSEGDEVLFGEFIFNIKNKQLYRHAERVILSTTESDLLHRLITNANTEVSRFDLSEMFNGISERSIDVQITRLRKKIEKDPKEPEFIQTVWGRGYIFVV